MFTQRILLLVASGIGVITGATADGTSGVIQYRPIAQRLDDGQYQPEVWRRSGGHEERAFVKYQSYPSETSAAEQACAFLQKYFDRTSSCADPRAPTASSETAAVQTSPLIPSTQPAPLRESNTAVKSPNTQTNRARNTTIDPSSNKADRGDNAARNSQSKASAAKPKHVVLTPLTASKSNSNAGTWGTDFWDHHGRGTD